jgi:hypothetical protein
MEKELELNPVGRLKRWFANEAVTFSNIVLKATTET